MLIAEADSSNNDFFTLQSLAFDTLSPAAIPLPGGLPLLAFGSACLLLLVRRIPRSWQPADDARGPH